MIIGPVMIIVTVQTFDSLNIVTNAILKRALIWFDMEMSHAARTWCSARKENVDRHRRKLKGTTSKEMEFNFFALYTAENLVLCVFGRKAPIQSPAFEFFSIIKRFTAMKLHTRIQDRQDIAISSLQQSLPPFSFSPSVTFLQHLIPLLPPALPPSPLCSPLPSPTSKLSVTLSILKSSHFTGVEMKSQSGASHWKAMQYRRKWNKNDNITEVVKERNKRTDLNEIRWLSRQGVGCGRRPMADNFVISELNSFPGAFFSVHLE